MNLKELANQYLEGERAVRERISELNKTLNSLPKAAQLEQEQRIRRLYAIATDAHKTALFLMNYYD